MAIWLIMIIAAAYLIYRSNKKKAAQRRTKEDYIEAQAKVIMETPCAKCGKMVEEDFRHCPYCGAGLK